MHRTRKEIAEERRREILTFIKVFMGENQYAPSVREIAHEVEIKSISTVFSDLKALEEQGFLTLDCNKSRSIVLSDEETDYRIAANAAGKIAAFCGKHPTCDECWMGAENCVIASLLSDLHAKKER